MDHDYESSSGKEHGESTTVKLASTQVCEVQIFETQRCEKQHSEQNSTEHAECVTVHRDWMMQALELARQALDAREVPVGCVLVHDGKLIASGRNRVNETKNPTYHAEFVAFEELIQYCQVMGKEYSRTFAESTLYVTVEPCIMCAAGLRIVGVPKVVYGCGNERFGGCGSVLDVHHGNFPSLGNAFETVSGVCADEAVDLLKSFYKGENPNAPEHKRKLKEGRE